MSIRDTYAELLTEQIIRDLLALGRDPTAAAITELLQEYLVLNDISKPVFKATNYSVDWGEYASSSKWNNANSTIEQDLKVIYRHLLKIADSSLQHFDRWRVESNLLEGKLNTLSERVNSLLLLAQDTAGYLNFMQDNFDDAEKTDLANTTAILNTDKGYVAMGTSSIGSTRVNLNELKNEDIEFALLTRKDVIETTSAQGSETRYVVSDVSNFWQERVAMRRPGPVSVEVKIKLAADTDISRIDIDLHQANSNSATTVTPMLSTDNYSFERLSTDSFTREIVDKATFQFTETSTRYIKFIMTKAGYDLVKSDSDQPQYIYEFGIDEVVLYAEGFDSDTTQTFVSQPLTVTDEEGTTEEFSKLTLEVCEDVPEDTSINYSVAVFDEPTTAFGSLAFVDIDPITRDNTSKPTVLDFGDLDIVEISGVFPSYNQYAGSGIFLNPAQDYKYVTGITGATITTSSGQASAPRYAFELTNQVILDYTLASGIQVARGTLELWRNVSTRGDNTTVRAIANGWGFEDPYYKTTVYAENPAGLDIDFGSAPVIIDGVPITGKTNVAGGVHVIQVHKDNWQEVPTVLTGLDELKQEDELYPHNHRYLIEGFEYPSGWPVTDEKIYQGFDIIAEYLMTEVSVFDINHNVAANNYRVFARDVDVDDSSALLDGVATVKQPSVVFLVKIDEDQADFVNEQYLLKFKSANSLFSHLRLKAVMQTEDSNITPFLSSYRIKIST